MKFFRVANLEKNAFPSANISVKYFFYDEKEYRIRLMFDI